MRHIERRVAQRSVNPNVLRSPHRLFQCKLLHVAALAMTAVAGYVRIPSLAPILKKCRPPRHHLLEVIRIYVHDVFQREYTFLGHPGQCIAFTDTHCATGENHPGACLFHCPLNNCVYDAVLPSLAINRVAPMVHVIARRLRPRSRPSSSKIKPHFSWNVQVSRIFA